MALPTRRTNSLRNLRKASYEAMLDTSGFEFTIRFSEIRRPATGGASIHAPSNEDPRWREDEGTFVFGPSGKAQPGRPGLARTTHTGAATQTGLSSWPSTARPLRTPYP